MSQEATQSPRIAPEPVQPAARQTAVPIWLFVLLFLLLYWGMVYFDQNGGWFSPAIYAPYRSYAELQEYQPPSGGPDLQRGKTVYENVCGLCHNNDGTGKPGQAPPFVGSDWVTGSPNRMIRIPLAGLSGPVVVGGQTWTLSMPAMGAALPDDDLAAVLTYIRQTFGKKASPITTDQVKAVRAQVGSRTQPWTAEQLNAVQ